MPTLEHKYCQTSIQPSKIPPNQPQICPNSVLKKNPNALPLSPKSALKKTPKCTPFEPQNSPLICPNLAL